MASHPTPQIACDRCTLGVMDANNPHLWGRCSCACHRAYETCPACRQIGGGIVRSDGHYFECGGESHD